MSQNYASKCIYRNLCLCQIAVFATASWSPPSSPPSLFPVSLHWPLTPLSLHLCPAPLPPSVLTLSVAAAPRPLVLLHRLTAFGPACLSRRVGSLHGRDRLPSLHRAGLASPTHHAGRGHNQLPTLSLHQCQQPQPQPKSLHQLQHLPLLLSQLRLQLQLQPQCSPASLTGQAPSARHPSHQLRFRLRSLLRSQLRLLSQSQHLLRPQASIQVYQCGPATLVGTITPDSQDGLDSIQLSCLHTGFHPHPDLS